MPPNEALSSMWRFEPTPKAPGSKTRGIPVEETERRVRPLLARIPVTRVADLSPLDPLGLPVWSAVTPLARDLTTHLGKGLDPASARVSALMEAIERSSAESAGPAVRATLEELARSGGPEPIDPETFDLPPGTAWRRDRPFDWIPGFDLGRGMPVRIPADLATSPPREGILTEVDTNGLASGNGRLEAVVHGLCEAIERDVLGQHEFCALYADPGEPRPPARAIDPATLPAGARDWVERTLAAGLEVLVHDLTGDLGVATYRTLVLDPAYPAPEGFVLAGFPGFGSHPDAEVAATRSVTEAIQSRLATIQGARDSYNVFSAGLRSGTRLDRLRAHVPGPRGSFAETPSHPARDLLDDLAWLLGRLRGAGLDRVVAADLTRADLGIPVVRIRVPGLSSFVVNQRRVGWRCRRWLL